MRSLKEKLIIFVMLVAAIFSFTTAYANLFDNNSNYEKYTSDEISASYLDLNSIEVLRYDPPFYAIKVNDIYWPYDTDQFYLVTPTIYLYNFNTKVVKRNTEKTIFYSQSDGSYLETRNDFASYDVSPTTNAGYEADYVFFKYYGIHFYY